MDKIRRILVTAGDTYELIDGVRRITHMATGHLGSTIADEFTRNGAKVVFLCGEQSVRPSLEVERTIEISGIKSLQENMITILNEIQFDGVIHSMAVSDYVFRGLSREDDLINEIYKNVSQSELINKEELYTVIKKAINNTIFNPSSKISSNINSIFIQMDRAPKVISYIKKMQPKTVLVGFKLLSNVSEQELIEAAHEQMKNSHSDFVLANDLELIGGDKHVGLLINKNGVLEKLKNKQNIAKSIVSHVMNEIGK